MPQLRQQLGLQLKPENKRTEDGRVQDSVRHRLWEHHKKLDKIKSASTPGRFTQDFLATKLGLKGGTPKPVIPFLKRTGFLNSDGTPTELYRHFRNPAQSGAAAAQALRKGFASLYEVNEYAHELKDADLNGLIVQITGAGKDSSTVKAIAGSFKALKAYAQFDGSTEQLPADESDELEEETDDSGIERHLSRPLNLGYTINLHLPPTSDIAVFNAIFKSLREQLLR